MHKAFGSFLNSGPSEVLRNVTPGSSPDDGRRDRRCLLTFSDNEETMEDEERRAARAMFNLAGASDHGTPVSFAKQGVETGQLEEAVLQIVRASLNIAAEQSTPPSIPERVPASRRLGLNDQQKSESAERSAAVSTNSSRGRIPANQRLGPSDQMNLLENEYGAEDPACSSRDRLPATQRLGPSDQLKVVRDGKLAEGPASNSRSRLPAS
ncbi:hypothetical protein Bca52824_001014 [Brassica carinata]|uniref:Uncharacterized protein n=1 Tax=Brassica carinata TaxID=52824 RepID=A0A8X7WFJ3_BRACI|nr:hypothetical protein Bca52824_001014 [Brassica carinata]